MAELKSGEGAPLLAKSLMEPSVDIVKGSKIRDESVRCVFNIVVVLHNAKQNKVELVTKS